MTDPSRACVIQTDEMPLSESPWWMIDRAAQFRAFADADGRTAPLYRRFADAAAGDPEVLALLDAAPGPQQRSVLLFASVHFLVLADPGCDLARFYPSVDPEAAAANAASDPWPAFRAFSLDRRNEIEALIATRNTQTNEVGRCAALAPALELVRRATGQPLSLLEVGASAGLNLCLDRYRIEYGAPTWVPPVAAPAFVAEGSFGDPGSPVLIRARVVGEHEVPVAATGSVPFIADRIGLDLAPVDVTDDEAVRWLEACVFADRTDRLGRLRAAVRLARHDPPRVVAGDAVADLAAVARIVDGQGPLVVLHSWALTYVEDRDGFAREVAALASDRDVWWLAAEPSTAVPGLVVPRRDERYTPEMAANTVVSIMHLRRRGARADRVLARSHPHLDWIHWLAPEKPGLSPGGW